MIKIALALVLLGAVVRAETYSFADGKTDESAAGRCGKNVSNWTNASTLSFGSDVMLTIVSNGHRQSFAVDRVATSSGGSADNVDYMFDTSPTHTVTIRINALDCADSHCNSMNVTYVVQVHPDAPASMWDDKNTCHETWKGKTHRGK